jgi:hypothetical protein
VDNFIQISDKELASLLFDKYSYLIDDYVDFPQFMLMCLDVNDVNKLITINISCETHAIPVEELESYLNNESLENYLFAFSINYQFTGKELILFRYGKLPISYDLPKYKANKIRKLRDIKLNNILNNV